MDKHGQGWRRGKSQEYLEYFAMRWQRKQSHLAFLPILSNPCTCLDRSFSAPSGPCQPWLMSTVRLHHPLFPPYGHPACWGARISIEFLKHNEPAVVLHAHWEVVLPLRVSCTPLSSFLSLRNCPLPFSVQTMLLCVVPLCFLCILRELCINIQWVPTKAYLIMYLYQCSVPRTSIFHNINSKIKLCTFINSNMLSQHTQ